MSLQWHYLDSQGTEFGPFDAQRMRSWHDQGYFSVAGDNLLVRLAEWKDFKRIGELYSGDKASYFVSAPRTPDGEESSRRDRDRSRSPRRRRDEHEAQPANDWYGRAGAGYPPAGYPYGHSVSPWYGYPGAPPGPWGAAPPGPWGQPAGMPPGAPRPYGWPPMSPHGPSPYGGYWPPPPHGAYGHPLPALPDYRSSDDRESGDRDRRERRRSRSRVDEKARRAEEEAEALRKLGRDGLRDLLTSTLESLYKDRIRPMANYVKGRLKERSSPDVVIRQFLDLYGQHSDLFKVNQADPDEASVFLVTEPTWFKGWVDLESTDDPYDEDMWQALKEFLEEGAHAFAGGRYGMARELVSRNLSFLAPYSLGEICHIVQLAIQHRKIIAYHKKMLKPMQGTLALANVSSNNGAGGAAADNLEEIGDLLQLCKVLFKTLRKHPQGIRLDRMKQMIKEECSCRLNEMAFKCTKLTELFRQEPLSSTFTLENDGKAFFVRPVDVASFSEEVRRIHDEVSGRDAGA
mmetsp:Transcript_19417/g.56402  ORF Transcript_19417/g.56402 Transcript_19417/m.56402 type:complete len:517 (-) Transcript_19417:135-1685(-)